MSKAEEESAASPLKAFRELIASGPPEPPAWDGILAALEKEALLEHALSTLRLEGAGPAWEPFRGRLKAAVARSRERRMSRWQADPERRTLRLRFSVAGPACALHPPALLAQLAKALLDAGLPLAMGLEKVPRPAVHLGHPLPLGVPGHGEWADASLLRAAPGALEDLPALVAPHAPEGLSILSCVYVPNYASPVSELCRTALWRWACPDPEREGAAARVAAFLASVQFDMEKPGKTGGQKGVKRVDIRPLVESMEWEGGSLAFRTRIQAGQAPSPLKLLGAILGVEPGGITGLERLELALGEDPRLQQADRYEPKLHNMFEDAVLLDAGSHIRIVDGDDDDPIILGG